MARVRSSDDNAVVQTVSVTTVAQEAARQLREMAQARGVEVRVAESMPTLTVDVGRLELAFVNLLSNAIKYSDADKAERYVEVQAGRSARTVSSVSRFATTASAFRRLRWRLFSNGSLVRTLIRPSSCTSRVSGSGCRSWKTASGRWVDASRPNQSRNRAARSS